MDLQTIRENISQIEKKIDYSFKDKELLILAFVHRSYVNEHREEIKEHNERLEFLGDAVLGILISDYLFQKFPKKPEGELSELKSSLVEAASCCMYLQTLELESFIILGKGEEKSTQKAKESIYADVFEALLAAIYLDGGFLKAKKALFAKLQRELLLIIDRPSENYKAKLQDYTQKNFKKIPVYKLLKTSGPDHEKIFEVAVILDQKELGKGVGGSKKDAQQKAAKNALKTLSEETNE